MGRPRQIDRAAVLRASVEIADELGLAAVTMQAVADRLGVTPMALYRHVENKDDLLNGIVECLLAEISEAVGDVSGTDGLSELGHAMRTTARRHPSAFPLMLQRPATTPAARQVRDRAYAKLAELGVSKSDVAGVERVMSTALLGFAASEVTGRFRRPRKEVDRDYEMLEDMLRAGLTAYLAQRSSGPARRVRT